MAMTPEDQQPAADQIAADPARDYRWKRIVLVVIAFGWGIWAIHDGYYAWPRDNADRAAKSFPPEHTDLDIQLNRVLGIALPPLSIVFLAWVFYNSRGCYRFDGTNIHIPGHPPIPLNALRKVDRAKWDRKGIAYIEYQIPGTATAGRFRLDDFIYRREPTDRIFEIIESAVAAPTAVAKPRSSPDPVR